MKLVAKPLAPDGSVVLRDPNNNPSWNLNLTVIIDFEGDIPRLNVRFHKPVIVGCYRFIGLVARRKLVRSDIQCTYDHCEIIRNRLLR